MKRKVFIEIIYDDSTEFHFTVEVEGPVHKTQAEIHMITRGTLQASSGKMAIAYNEEGFDICSYTR